MWCWCYLHLYIYAFGAFTQKVWTLSLMLEMTRACFCSNVGLRREDQIPDETLLTCLTLFIWLGSSVGSLSSEQHIKRSSLFQTLSDMRLVKNPTNRTLSCQYSNIYIYGLGWGPQLFKQGWEKLRHLCRNTTGVTFIHVPRLFHSDGMLLFLVWDWLRPHSQCWHHRHLSRQLGVVTIMTHCIG